MLLGENILTLSLYLYRKKTYSSNLLLLKYDTDMKREPVYIRIYHFYLEGFREMKLGKTLWLIILVKLFIMFLILRIFFFPDFLKVNFSDDRESGDYVLEQLTGNN